MDNNRICKAMARLFASQDGAILEQMCIDRLERIADHDATANDILINEGGRRFANTLLNYAKEGRK